MRWFQIKLDWKLFKASYPYICDKCGYLHWKLDNTCEGCGASNTIRKITKKDWKNAHIVNKTH